MGKALVPGIRRWLPVVLQHLAMVLPVETSLVGCTLVQSARISDRTHCLHALEMQALHMARLSETRE